MITFSGIEKSFGGRVILKRLEYTFESDRVYIVRGPSGAGKSTLLNIAAGYEQPDAGSVTVAEGFGYLMQDELLFSKLTVRQNLRIRGLGLRPSNGQKADERQSDEPATAALERLGIAHLADNVVADLSGGERRRVEIASMLLGDPRVLLFDEPTANLDPHNAASVYSALWDVRSGRTILIVTHELDVPGAPADTELLSLEGGALVGR
jgi:ABC-type multidrug transport system ATPase subunit